MIYLVTNQGITPLSAKGYGTGARWFLSNIELIDTSFIDRSKTISNTKQGLMNIWLFNDNNKDSQRRRLGASRDLIMVACRTYLRIDTNWQNHGAAMYLKCAFMMCARKGELIMCPNQNHHLKIKNVNFTVTKEDGLEILVTSLSISHYPLTVVTAVHLEKSDMKNDQTGEGHRHVFEKLLNFDADTTFCIVTDCYNWIKASQPRHAFDPFLSYPHPTNPTNSRLILNSTYPLNALRNAGKKCGLNPKRLTLYSLRIGATTTLAAEGENPLTIKFAGDWKSDSFMRYARATEAFSRRVASALQLSDKFTVLDMKKWSTAHNITDDEPIDKVTEC